jgi:hypothetical protein
MPDLKLYVDDKLRKGGKDPVDLGMFVDDKLRNVPAYYVTEGGGGTTYFGILKRWTGATWVKSKLMVYNGTWQAKKLKRWNGSAWKEVDATG